MIKKFLIALSVILMSGLAFAVTGTYADEADITVVSSDGYGTEKITDDDYTTTDYFLTDTTLTITSEEPMTGLYIKWDTEPGEWTLTIDGTDYTYGTHDFLHEYVELPQSATEVVITILTDRTYIADLYAFTAGDLPDWVQIWEDPYEEADILLISTHSDDEVLFFGGIIPTYINGGEYRVQVAYFCDMSLTESYRQHEQLDGLWTMGITHYPQLGEFEDVYSEDLDTALTQFDLDECIEYITGTIRRFKPQVVIAQDLDGEYGHGAHMVCALAVTEAIEITGDAAQYPDSAEEYGTWEVSKTYLHLYEENQIEIDARVPLEDFDGMTALEVATEAYLCHQSQQWMWFYVSDGYDEDGNATDYEYSCTKFGLYKTLVGADTGNDIMENIVSYDEQERLAAEAATETAETSETETTAAAETENDGDSVLKTILIIFGVIIAVLIIALIVLRIISNNRRKKAEARRREAQRRRRQQQMRQQHREYGGTGTSDRNGSSSAHAPAARTSAADKTGASGRTAGAARQHAAGSTDRPVRQNTSNSQSTSAKSGVESKNGRIWQVDPDDED